MQFRLGCRLDYLVPEPSAFIFNVAVARCPRNGLLAESMRLTPSLRAEERMVPETGARYTMVDVPAGRLALRYEARIALAPEPPRPPEDAEAAVGRIPMAALSYLFPSRYCQADLLTELACEVAGDLPPGPAQVGAVCDWVHANVRYRPGASGPNTSSLETVRDRAGVCRDFAHLAIALCRSLGIPARFVTGYAWGLPMPDFHACMEAFFDGGWHLFDPSRKVPTEHVVRIGTGRDAADASFATIFGDGRPSELTDMAVFAEPVAGEVPAERIRRRA